MLCLELITLPVIPCNTVCLIYNPTSGLSTTMDYNIFSYALRTIHIVQPSRSHSANYAKCFGCSAFGYLPLWVGMGFRGLRAGFAGCAGSAQGVRILLWRELSGIYCQIMAALCSARATFLMMSFDVGLVIFMLPIYGLLSSYILPANFAGKPMKS